MMTWQERREAVEQGLQVCHGQYLHHYCSQCPYTMDIPTCIQRLHRDARAILNEPEPLPVLHKEPSCMSGQVGYCPKCEAVLLENDYNPKYCGVCGQAVRWD